MDGILNDQRQWYRQLSGRVESWKTAHLEAMACRDIEDAIRLGTTFLENIRTRHSLSIAAMEKGEAEFSWDALRECNEAYRWWLEYSNSLLEAISTYEADHYKVEGADDFRKKVLDVSLMSLDVDNDRQSLASLEDGRGVPAKKAMDDLRNRLRRSLA